MLRIGILGAANIARLFVAATRPSAKIAIRAVASRDRERAATFAQELGLGPALGGGARMDVGSYPVSLVRMVAGECPSRVHAVARWAESGVDRTLAATMEFRSGLLAQVTCSFATARHRACLIVADAGT